MAKNKKSYGLMQAAAHGGTAGIAPNMNKDHGDKTPDNKRKMFAKAIMKKRKKDGC